MENEAQKEVKVPEIPALSSILTQDQIRRLQYIVSKKLKQADTKSPAWDVPIINPPTTKDEEM
mgnify:CR=1 FL=1